MSTLFWMILFLVAGVAAAFVAWPVWRGSAGRARAVLAAAGIVFVVGIGAGAYLMLGRPALGVRALEGRDTRDLNGLIALLARRLRSSPNDLRGWTMLGRAYFSAGDPDDASKAFAHAIDVANTLKRPSAELYSAYGESLTRAASGAVPGQAEAAFRQALILDPKDAAARYFLGYAFASRGQNAQAIALWQNLVADAPPGAAWRAELVDRIAALSAKSGAAPDISAMVAGLAARLKQQPDDLAGWQRLIRAYAVLGDADEARAALVSARAAFHGDGPALSALAAEAGELKLEK